MAGPTRTHLDWPFFGEEHRALAGRLDAFARSGVLAEVDHHDVDRSCRTLVAALGTAGLLEACTADADGEAAGIDPIKGIFGIQSAD